MLLDRYQDQAPRHAIVVANRVVSDHYTGEVRTLVLELAYDGEPVRVGHHVGVLPPELPAAPGATLVSSLRLYTIGHVRIGDAARTLRLTVDVKRCFAPPEPDGFRAPGVVSNYLCDRAVGDQVRLFGPLAPPFVVPPHDDASLFLVVTSAGIAPFREFVRYLVEASSRFHGKVWLLQATPDHVRPVPVSVARHDFLRYADDRAFAAFERACTRKHWTDAAPLPPDALTTRHWRLLEHPRSSLYLAGSEGDDALLIRGLAAVAGSEEQARITRRTMRAQGRWTELLYGAHTEA